VSLAPHTSCLCFGKADPVLVSVDVDHLNLHALTDGQSGAVQEPMHGIADLDEGAKGHNRGSDLLE
jgi:hypothetical protein